MDLYGDLTAATVNNVNTPIAVIDDKPQYTVMVDHQYEQILQQDTNEFVDTMKFSEQLTRAVIQIRDYIPNMQNEDNQEFWKKRVSYVD
jgi:hypothetical protein